MSLPTDPSTDPPGDAPGDAAPPVLLSVRDLVVQFKTEDGFVTAVDGLSYDLHEGETLGIVGESGSGKSVTNLAVMRLLPVPPAHIPRGEILFHGRDILAMPAGEVRKLRGHKMSMIFQDPMTCLNPFLRVSTQMAEVLDIHQGVTGKAAMERMLDMLRQVGLPDPEGRIRQYPHQFSGGMRQRVMIAMMLLNAPELLIADEPTTALDVTIQAQILELLKELQDRTRMAITLVTHDLGVVAGTADHVLVMYSGQTMESAPTDALFERPAHPYTLGLLRSLPRVDEREHERLYSIPGKPPDLANRPAGCPFEPRCAFARDICAKEFPGETRLGPNHRVYCWATDDVQELVATGEHLEAPE